MIKRLMRRNEIQDVYHKVATGKLDIRQNYNNPRVILAGLYLSMHGKAIVNKQGSWYTVISDWGEIGFSFERLK